MGWLAERKLGEKKFWVNWKLRGVESILWMDRNAESATYSGQREWRYVVESWSYRGEELDYLLV